MPIVANDTVLGETLAEAAVFARNWHLWAWLAGVALVIGLTGPFGTYTAMPVAFRLPYWAVVVVTTYWIGFFVSYAAATWIERVGLAFPWSTVFSAGVASVPVTLWLSLLHALILDDPLVAEFFRLLPYVVLIALVVIFLAEASDTRNAAVQDIPETSVTRPKPAWLDRLPPELGRDLLLLQAQDHYLRAKTPLGETLLRGSIGEASEALGDYGVRVHRSWWVSWPALRTYRSRHGARVVVLSTGEEVPVGRSYRRKVQEFIDRM